MATEVVVLLVQLVLLVLWVLWVLCVVEWLNHSKRTIVVRKADLNEFFSLIFRRLNVCVLCHANENCHFSSEKR